MPVVVTVTDRCLYPSASAALTPPKTFLISRP